MLDALPWRAAASVRDSGWFWRGLKTVIDFAQGIEKLLAVATVPDHYLNAEFLHRVLEKQSMVDRDPVFGLALGPSWEERGHARRLVDLARKQNLSTLSNEAATLLGVILGWFCSSSDRRIRDHATKALSRLLVERPELTAQLFARFASVDDDYIIERLLGAAYTASLATTDNATVANLARLAYTLVFAHDPVSENALIRDTARLMVEHAVSRGCDLLGIDLSRTRPPFKSTWPLTVGSDDWKALRERYPDFPLNMFLGSHIGTDFARYVAEPRVLNLFDLTGSGLSRDIALRWLFDQTLAFGYPGHQALAQHYDRQLTARHGSGRSRAHYAERLGKKYAWIGLARLAGILADNAKTASDKWRSPPKAGGLQGIKLRTIDPSDYVEDEASDEINPNHFWSAHENKPTTDDAWVATKHFPTLQPMNDGWVLLSSSVERRTKATDGGNDKDERHYRSTSDYAQARFVAKTDETKLAGTLKRNRPDLEMPELSGVYIGEYPDRLPFRERYGETIVDQPVGKIMSRLAYLMIERQRKYDGSVEERQPLRVPAPDIIRFGGLRWNLNRGWIDANGNCQALHITSNGSEALVVKRDLLDRYLAERGLAVFWVVGQTKQVVRGFADSGGMHEQIAAYAFNGSDLKMVTCWSEHFKRQDT